MDNQSPRSIEDQTRLDALQQQSTHLNETLKAVNAEIELMYSSEGLEEKDARWRQPGNDEDWRMSALFEHPPTNEDVRWADAQKAVEVAIAAVGGLLIDGFNDPSLKPSFDLLLKVRGLIGI